MIKGENMRPSEKMDKLLAGDIDVGTFKDGIDVLLKKNRRGDDIAYC